jgi:hypothetical protein
MYRWPSFPEEPVGATEDLPHPSPLNWVALSFFGAALVIAYVVFRPAGA